MRDLYLRFWDQEEANQQLISAGFILENAYLISPPGVNIDTIGIILAVEPTEELGEDTKYSEVPGYHVNLRVTDEDLDLSILDPYLVHPENPVRIWA